MPAILAEHIDYAYVQTIDAPPAVMFPLLCPEREKEWIPGWDARMIHSHSGLVEPAAVFATPYGQADTIQGETLWYTVEHKPPYQIRFVRFQPDGVIVDIDITVEPKGADQSTVNIRYRFTATSKAGTETVRKFTPAAWQEMMQQWQSLMNHWLAQHPQRR